MNLSLDMSLVEGYKSKPQQARIMTESWVARNIYCPNCGSYPINGFENNRPVADFYCSQCSEEYELKSKNGKFSSIIPDGAHSTMLERIQSERNPNFFFLNYSTECKVKNFVVVPKHFFTPEVIVKRKPLAPTARRAGWVGCNIDIRKVSTRGTIFLIKDGLVVNQDEVLSKFQQTLFLREQSAGSRGWLLEILKCLDWIPTNEFTLNEMYAFEDYLKRRYPKNNYIKDKIRQQLQVLRDQGMIEFLGGGRYKKLYL